MCLCVLFFSKNYALEKSLKLPQYNIPRYIIESLHELKEAGENAKDKLKTVM